MVAIQVRDVPDDVREALVGEARRRGVSLQVLLQDVLAHEAKMARNRAWLAEMRKGPIARIDSSAESTVGLIHRLRDERTQQILDAVFPPPNETA
ncbi:hypothetical protein GCM10009840_08490 [Pseudolysinimonas kribbensis]|jgi:post-segregation antitoxin (ccd killing protein)|uniref:hypothetical protein n=1 Tax=Pseudolysinimonas kribbensis TaxID=433641 RepID=UPI0031D71979